MMRGDKKIGIILASHHQLADILAKTVDMIIEGDAGLIAFSLGHDEDPKSGSRRLQDMVKKCGQGKGVIILVDLFGGTPGSLAMSLIKAGHVEVITGVNLPMAIAAAMLDPKLELQEAAEAIIEAGNNSIQQAGAVLKS